MKKAFTLTELLVVIVILAVLASFLFPLGSQAKLSAQVSGCGSNLHQMYVAQELYINDNGDLPPIRAGGILTKLYLGGVKLICPAQKSLNLAEDYIPTTIPDPTIGPAGSGTRRVKGWWDCRELRGSDFPLVADLNHATAVYAHDSGGEAFFLIARANGQIKRIPEAIFGGMLIGKTKPPCAVELGYLNL